MREHHIMKSILDKALLKARQDGATRIQSLRLAIGEIAELDRDAMQGHWMDISRGTLAEGAQVHFRIVPAEVQCMACFHKYHPTNGQILCPRCGGMGAKILAGEECSLEEIDVSHE